MYFDDEDEEYVPPPPTSMRRHESSDGISPLINPLDHQERVILIWLLAIWIPWDHAKAKLGEEWHKDRLGKIYQ
jgi:hypothetical protein